MPTSVRVEDEVKEEFDRLQGLVLAETGERLSHSALLARLLRFADRRRAAFFQAEEAAGRPTREGLLRVLARAGDPGVETDARRIDEALYGGERS